MKARKLFLLLLSAVLFACSEDFITLSPESQLATAQFYRTEEDVNQAVNAAYASLQSIGQYGQNFVYYMEVCTDNSTMESITNSGGRYGDFELFRVKPINATLNETWVDCYKGIQRCNIVLNRIGNVPMQQTVKDIRVGEVKFIRALTYFNIVRIWGDMPLILHESTDPFAAFADSRESADNVYAQIERDLQEAAAALPAAHGSAETGRATRGAALALLGKVYLTRGKFSEAAVILSEVIQGSQYSLLPEFASLFTIAGKNNSESVFEIQFKKGIGGEGSRFANLFAPVGASDLVGGVGVTLGDNVPTQSFHDAFAAADKRRDATIGKLSNDKLYCRKYLDKPASGYDADNNFYVLRYADVLLMAAEALNEERYVGNGDAFRFINQVRVRAGLDALTASDAPDQESFRKAVADERRFELAFENHRWFDLVRTGKAIETLNGNVYLGMAITVEPYQLLFPVPQTQIDTSPEQIKQNKDYN